MAKKIPVFFEESKMKILIIGSGGREHALAWKMSKSSRCEKLFIAPGNAGTSLVGENISIDPLDFESIGRFCMEEDIGLVVVGPEEPLVKGLRNYFNEDQKLQRILFIGPDAEGACLEGSKDFAKEFMKKYQVPTALHRTFTKETLQEGMEFLETLSPPFVLKADGLAAGKGVIIVDEVHKAKNELKELLTGDKLGEASKKVVIEEYLDGIEVSFFVLTDGSNFVVLPEAKDYKRIGEGDTGLNTGGMGAVSPVVFADHTFKEKVLNRIIIPTIEGLKKEKIDYVGFIFIGLMNVNGNPYVIEYNCRMGDPETEVVIPRLQNDLVDLLVKTAQKKLNSVKIEMSELACSTVMLVSGGYPGSYDKNKTIAGIHEDENSIVFHAGTKRNSEGAVITNGGRVIAITSLAESLNVALKNCYNKATEISFDGMYYRRDIGQDLLHWNRESLLGKR